jgi:hypothetical protein
MRLNVVAAYAGLAALSFAALSLAALPATAAPKKTTAVDSRGNTVVISRDEDGKTHTRIIIQKRSYLDPGTETFLGENTGFEGHPFPPTQHPTGVLDNTVIDAYGHSALPGPFTLPGKNNPWVGY